MKPSELLAHHISFNIPKRLTPVTAWQEHIPFAMFLVDVLKPRMIVELGTHAGDSFCAFCEAVSELNLETRCYGIDTWTGDEHSGFYDATILNDLRAHHDPLYGTFSTLVQSTFDDAVQYFADGSIDLLHIDGYHTYERVTHDFETWLPKLADRAVVLFHDINVREHGFGIWRFWEKLKLTYPTFEFAHGHGLGVLSATKIVPRQLDFLFGATDHYAKAIRNYFFTLGNRLTLLRATDVKERMVRERDARLTQTQAELENAKAENIALTEKLSNEKTQPQRDVADLSYTLQLFWLTGDCYSEDNSLKAGLITDSGLHHYYFSVPSHTPSLRIDPGNQPALIDIKRIELFANDPRETPEQKSTFVWSPSNRFEGLEPLSGILVLESQSDFVFICTDHDPQLVLRGLPEKPEGSTWFLKVILRVTTAPEQLFTTVTDEIAGLRDEITIANTRVDEEISTRGADIQKQFELKVETLTQEMESQAAHFEAQIIHKDASLNQLERQLSDKQKLIALLQRLSEEERQKQVALLDQREQLIGEKDQKIESLRLGLSDAEERVRNESTKVEGLERDVAELRNQLLDQKRIAIERDSLRQQLSATHTYVQNITSTRGWKALSRYREAKYSLLSGLERIARATYQPSLKPLHDIRATDDELCWESTGIDPQFEVVGPWPQGWSKIVFEVDTDEPVLGNSRLYVNRGNGYSEADSYDLGSVGQKQVTFVELGPDVVQLRLDPFDGKNHFRIKKFILKSVSKRQVIESPRRNGHATVVAAPAAPEFRPPSAIDPYQAWIEVNRMNERRERMLCEKLAKLSKAPLLSVVMPVFNPPVDLLDKAIRSVGNQVYTNWELCIADDASTDPAVRLRLQELEKLESRIRVVYREVNGNISLCTNSAAEIARGDYLVLMDQDDEITPDALGEVAHHLSIQPETDILYSDDDKIDLSGRRFDPQFKPDWSPELLLSYMYFSHLFVLRRELFFDVGGMRLGFEGSQDYDLALRTSERARKICHIPKVLYHWRVVPGSTAASGDSKPNSFVAGKRAVEEALARANVNARVLQPDWAIRAGCGIFSCTFGDEGPSVAILIPTRNNLKTLKACLNSLAKTSYKNYEIVIIDNESDDVRTCEFLASCAHRVLRIPSPGGKFSFAAINNRAAAQVKADYLLFLNDDTEALTEKWLSQMVGYLSIRGVGAVGARLIFPDQRIQHAGIVHGYYDGMAGPAFKLTPAWDHGYLSYAMVSRNYSAVTAACMLTRRDLFLALNGFDEEKFAVAYNDVDYCYRLNAAGHRVVYCPTAEFTHHEGYSRGRVDNPGEPAAFREKYQMYVDHYYSPNLSLLNEQFRIDARTIAQEDIPPIKTLMCAFNLNLEGAPYSQFELTFRLRDQGIIDPVVYCPKDGPLRKEYESKGIRLEVAEHPLAGVSELAAYEKAIDRFSARLEDWGVELVYGNTLQTFYCIAAARRSNLPSIWNPRESEPWQSYFDYLGAEIAPRALECFSYPYKIVFVSHATRRAWKPLESHHNFTTIHNGLDRDRFHARLAKYPRDTAREELAIRPGEIVLLSVGTVCDRKGQVDLIQALARLNDDAMRGVRCFIVGDRESHYSTQLHSLYSELPPSHQARIKIVAEISEVERYYAAADIFVCTSRIESYPRVIMEAMCAKLPIITTPVFGIIEQVQQGVNALIYEPSDTAALADAIVRLAADSSLRAALAYNSEHVLNGLTSYDEMVSGYARIFREAWLSGGPRDVRNSWTH